MKEKYLGDDLKLFKINKAKPLQLKRNLYIEKYIDNYLADNKNKEKLKNSKISRLEENKENFFVRKTVIPQQKLFSQEFEDTQSTTMILSNSNKTEKSGNNINKFPYKSRTMSGPRISKNGSSNIVVYKKNIPTDCFLKTTTNIKTIKLYNNNITNKYERNYISDSFNNHNNALTGKNPNDTLTKKLKRESTFSNFYYDMKSIVKHNRYYSKNSTCIALEKNLNENKNKENNNMNTKRKIHKEINIEDFLLIEKKFETIRNLFSNFVNKNKNTEPNNLINSINFHIYDLYKFYMNSSIEGSPENMFSSIKAKTILHDYSIIFIFTLGTIFVNNLFNYDLNKGIILFNIQQKLFLLFCDAILKKLNSKYNNNIWIKKLLIELNNKLIFNISDHLFQIRLLTQNSFEIINDLLNSLKKNINVKPNVNQNYEKTQIFLSLYGIFVKKGNFDSLKIIELEELFNKNIFMYENKLSHSNMLNDINCVNNEYYNINKYDEIDTKVPFLKFPCKKEYTLILDLDETLICFKSSKVYENIGNIHIRPGLEIFLEIIKEFFEIIIFTIGTREYANIILDLIEKKNNTKYFDGRLYRDHATKVGNKYIKDLSKIGRDLSKTLIVDNNPHSFKLQYENGILISSYYGEKNDDKALIELQKILIKIYKEKGDVRESISKYKEEIIQKISSSNETK